MKELHECINEIKARGNRKIRARRKRLAGILTCCVAVCICISAAVALPRGKTPSVPPASDSSEVGAFSSEALQSESEEADRVLITATAPDGVALEAGEMMPYRNMEYIAPALKELLNANSDDAYYRVIVEILYTFEDSKEFAWSDKLNGLFEKVEAAHEVYQKARDEADAYWIEHPQVDDPKLKELKAIEDEKKAIYSSYHEEYFRMESTERNAYESEIMDGRMEYVRSLAGDMVSLEGSSDLFGCMGDAYFAELSGAMIKEMAKKGGYAFRLAPAARKDGYDVRISDYLTTLLDDDAEGKEYHVAVVLAVDSESYYAYYRLLCINNGYNSEYIKPLESLFPNDDRPLSQIPEEELLAAVAEYQDNVVGRNGLSDKRIMNGSWLPDVNAVGFGFEASLTKAEILSLAMDEDVKVIYSMDFRYESADLVPGWENE